MHQRVPGSVRQIRELVPVASRPADALHDLATHLTMAMFQTSGELLERPARREELTERLVRVIQWVFTGALAGVPTATS